ncbi:hypothetical protein G9A89_000944 [Geosiphon pyriformis]|nr:hypothetical protein G9A89_000944 [Geosiphon pyriformis]
MSNLNSLRIDYIRRPSFPPQVLIEDIIFNAVKKLEKAGKVSKIPNAFMIYLMALRKEYTKRNIGATKMRALASYASVLWGKEKLHVKTKYNELHFEAQVRFNEICQTLFPIRHFQVPDKTDSSQIGEFLHPMQSSYLSQISKKNGSPIQLSNPEMNNHLPQNDNFPITSETIRENSLTSETYEFPGTLVALLANYSGFQNMENQVSLLKNNSVIQNLENRVALLENFVDKLLQVQGLKLLSDPTAELQDRISYLEMLLSVFNLSG